MNPQQKGPEPGRGWCEPTARSRQVAGLAATVPASRRVINPSAVKRAHCLHVPLVARCPPGGLSASSSGGLQVEKSVQWSSLLARLEHQSLTTSSRSSHSTSDRSTLL